MANHNFLQWNPTAQNNESDAAYAADQLRANGAAQGPSVFPSGTANKLFYQVSTFVKSLADAMAAKGYSLFDVNVGSLAAGLANIMTQADMVPYALLTSPVFRGIPTAPTPPVGVRSAQLATMQVLSNEFPAVITSVSSTQVIANGIWMQFGHVLLPTGNGDTITMPLTFPNDFLEIVAMDWGSTVYNVSGGPIAGSRSNAMMWSTSSATGAYVSATIRYVAFGH